MKKFEEYNLKEKTKEFIRRNGFTEPTPIQAEVIGNMLRGKDVIGLSKTGTGKTHAYLIPLMEMVDPSIDHPQAVITAPTRELAAQIFEKAKVMSEVDPSLRIKLLIGGRERSKDEAMLAKEQPHIVIGTPGRIRDLFLNGGSWMMWMPLPAGWENICRCWHFRQRCRISSNRLSVNICIIR